MSRFHPVEPSKTGTEVRGTAQLIQVNDRVYCATEYAISNVLYVLTGTSVVVIDTTESMAAARASFDEFRKICSLPVSHIIYTHFHGDHIRGAKVFHMPSTQVIAQRKMPEERANVERMLPYRKRITALQFGFQLKPQERGVTLVNERESGYIPPDILFDEEHKFQEGDLSFELYHTQGETVDHLMIWIPEIRTLFPGDLYYSTFPMLSNPMRPDRPVLAWAESLARIRALQPLYLVPSHSKPLSGAEEIESVLTNYERAIRYIHDETVKRINQGLTLEETRRQVKLPEDLARLPYLQERYGTAAWSVTGVFRQYTGWYTFNPTDLNPGPRATLYQALLDASGGPGPLLTRARQALREDQDQLVLELTDIVLSVRPRNRAAHAIRVKALRRLGDVSENGVEQNVYRTAAKKTVARISELDPLNSVPENTLGHEYTGVWTRPDQVLSTGEKQTSLPVTTLAAEPVRSAPATRLLQARTVATINRWYNTRMYLPRHQEVYDGSFFHNFGYWMSDTQTLKEACENLMKMLLAFIPEKAGTILDVACGLGGTTQFLLRDYPPESVTGINISAKQLRTCRLNAPKCTFIKMNATDMRFANESFDNIICVESAFHFVTREKFLSDAHRVLKPGGRLVLSDIVPALPRNALGALAPMARVLSPEEYRNLYFEAGFERVEIIDATSECNIGRVRYHLRSLRARWRRAEISRQTFQQRKAHSFEKIRKSGYYLLVSAQKGKSQ